jgi:hypothetical protein
MHLQNRGYNNNPSLISNDFKGITEYHSEDFLNDLGKF